MAFYILLPFIYNPVPYFLFPRNWAAKLHSCGMKIA
jgi:hypothetical protein